MEVFRKIACKKVKNKFGASDGWYGKEKAIVGFNFVLK